MIARLTLPVLALLLPSAAPAQAAEYTRVLTEQSRVAFVSRQMGVPVEGQFRRFSVQLAFDPARPETARASLEIDLASIDAGSKEANEEVVGRNWFNVRQFPTARFQSTGLRHLGGNRYELRGPMTLKGRSGELVLPITFTPAGAGGAIEGGFVLRRLAWGIGEGPWGDPDTVADEVQVKFRFVVAEAAATPAAGGKPARKP
ncbi:MAG: YceI family protein [Thiobacillaceae bacterium]|jgi:polyisoprenoid-binding protein YceI|nr:YceI family protein [Thiobacillaceae bacterium]